MPEDVELEELYSRLEKIHGDSLKEKSAEAYRKSTQERMDIEITTDSEKNPLRVIIDLSCNQNIKFYNEKSNFKIHFNFFNCVCTNAYLLYF
jgi:hypothetical protein